MISNGFESRVFVENGHPYLTVSEISSGRVDIRHAPRIDFSITVPQKASATRNCVLVVRSGSLGIAAKVHRDDEGAAISSHLIRLEFGDEELAAAVAVFLGSPAGRELMVRASYGAVIPQLGQDELLDIPIPNHILSLKRPILNLLNSYEQAIRIAGSLVQSAKLLVEALIEGKITEDEIAEVQMQLEHGDQTVDRAILARLYEGGIDATEGIRLFNDLDMYYETLRLAEKTDENEPTNDANYCL